MAKWISIASMVVATIGVFFGFYYYFGHDVPMAVAIVTLATVGIGGLLAFVRHVIFHKEDAAALGWDTDRPDWMFEVGFANLAFGFMGLVAVLAKWGVQAQVLVLLGFALYLFQAAGLHAYRYATAEEKSAAELWRGVVATLALAGLMTFFAIAGLLG